MDWKHTNYFTSRKKRFTPYLKRMYAVYHDSCLSDSTSPDEFDDMRSLAKEFDVTIEGKISCPNCLYDAFYLLSLIYAHYVPDWCPKQ